GGVQRRARRGRYETRVEVSRRIRPRRPRASPGGRGAPFAAEFQSQGAIMKEVFRRNGVTPNMLQTAFFLITPVPADVSAQQKPTTGYAPVNGVKMYYEVHGSGEPVVLLHGAFMTITNNWTGWIGELSKTRKVIAVEMQAHGRTADIPRDITYENLADDVAA